MIGFSHSVAWCVGQIVSYSLSGGSFLTHLSCKDVEVYFSLDWCKKTQSPWLSNNHGLWTLSPVAASVSIKGLIGYLFFSLSPLWLISRAGRPLSCDQLPALPGPHLCENTYVSENLLSHAFNRLVRIDCASPLACPRCRLRHRHLIHHSWGFS